jgi:hypothetical protein
MDAQRDRKGNLVPTGTCWCGCGEPTARDSFFAHGHNAEAEAMLLRLEYGSVPQFLVAHGYGPGSLNLRQHFEWGRKDGGCGQ